jgi:hypothetical protein
MENLNGGTMMNMSNPKDSERPPPERFAERPKKNTDFAGFARRLFKRKMSLQALQDGFSSEK